MEKGVSDANLAARLATLGDSTNWDTDEVVESVHGSYSGEGQTDIRVTILILPSDYTNDEYRIQTFDGEFKPTGFTLAAAYRAYITSYTGTTPPIADGWGTSATIISIPTSGIAGRCIRQQRIRETVSFTRTEPDISGLIHPMSFTDYTREAKFKDPSLGFWTKRSIRVETGVWVSEVPV